jgi:putative peptidoglycan lipid II flippase
LRGLSPSLDVRAPGVIRTLHAFVPVLIGRGSVQISAYVDQTLATFLGTSVVAAMAAAQTLYLIPISLFGMSISAAELPEMSGGLGDDAARAAHLRGRLDGSIRRVIFLVAPSALAFAAIGGSIVALLFQNGRFGHADSDLVWIVLVGAAFGLLPNTVGRLLNSAFYALGDTKTPLRAALVRVGFDIVVTYIVILPLRHALGYGVEIGALLSMTSSSTASWIEFSLLRRALTRRIERVPIPWRFAGGALVVSTLAGGAGYGAGAVGHHLGLPVWLSALAAIAVFGTTYLGTMMVARVPEASGFARRLLRR